MSATFGEDRFIPATTIQEASARIAAVAGRRVEATRGEKRALLALRDALGLGTPTVRTSAALGSSLAGELNVAWNPQVHVNRTTLTLAGVNALLKGAMEAHHAGLLQALEVAKPIGLTGERWNDFRPAPAKLEAVNRISALTNSGPERLGPGSKERKRVLVNLAAVVAPHLDTRALSKTSLGRELARVFDVPWGDHSISTSETIRLDGLNSLLAGAEEYFNRLGADLGEALQSPMQEAALLIATLKEGLPSGPWDGRECVEWMTRQGIRGANDSEWQGFFFEAYSRQILGMLPPAKAAPRVKYGQTVFDFAFNRVWDLKAHTQKYSRLTGAPIASSVILNDEEAVRSCVREQGLGFLVLNGRAVLDEDGSFRDWQNRRKLRESAASNSGRSRMRKSQFNPLSIEAFWIDNQSALDVAILSGAIKPWKQPRQAPRAVGAVGAARRNKLQMSLTRARNSLRLESVEY